MLFLLFEPTHVLTLLCVHITLPNLPGADPSLPLRGVPQGHPLPQSPLKAREGAAWSCSSPRYLRALRRAYLSLRSAPSLPPYGGQGGGHA